MQVLPMCLYLKMLVVKSALYPFKKMYRVAKMCFLGMGLIIHICTFHIPSLTFNAKTHKAVIFTNSGKTHRLLCPKTFYST